MPKPFGLPKKDRLKSRRLIDALFATGRSFNAFPVRMVFTLGPAAPDPGLKIGVSAPKKHFKKAVDRNRIKRLLREAYRLQKPELLQKMKEKGLAGHVFFLFTGKELPDYSTIEIAVGKCLRQLHRKVHETTT